MLKVIMMKLYDKDGNIIPLCYRCCYFTDFPYCDGFKDTVPECWRKMKPNKCGGYYYDKMFSKEWGKTYRIPPIKGKQNTWKYSKWNPDRPKESDNNGT